MRFLRIINRFASSGAAATPRRFVLIGAPGAGKGTQGAWLARDYNLAPISTGDLLRAVASGAAEDETAERIRQTLAAGKLVDAASVAALVRNALQSKEAARGWFLDGYPRTVEQAQNLSEILDDLEQPLGAVFYIKVDPEVIWEERLKDRWVHAPSGRTYHLTFNPPKVEGKDDETGEDLVQREDDNKESVVQRFETFGKATQPLLDYYGSLVRVIDSPNSRVGYERLQATLAELGVEKAAK